MLTGSWLSKTPTHTIIGPGLLHPVNAVGASSMSTRDYHRITTVYYTKYMFTSARHEKVDFEKEKEKRKMRIIDN